MGEIVPIRPRPEARPRPQFSLAPPKEEMKKDEEKRGWVGGIEKGGITFRVHRNPRVLWSSDPQLLYRRISDEVYEIFSYNSYKGERERRSVRKEMEAAIGPAPGTTADIDKWVSKKREDKLDALRIKTRYIERSWDYLKNLKRSPVDRIWKYLKEDA